jgi:A/G-specific adenine glycosylase
MKNIEWNDSFFLSQMIKAEDLSEKIALFKKMLWQFYAEQRRSFWWREEITPYRIFISEVMLQQTQTSRVEHKFVEFISVFPELSSLASASLHEVLAVWSGLGYNRRGRFLWQAAQMIQKDWQGFISDDPQKLVLLPGIGPNTAGSIVAFAYNKPTLFLETNVRAVLIHYFFSDRDGVHDKELLPLLEQIVDKEQPRDFYYAIMDLGVLIKKAYKNPTRKSLSYTKQSPFEGSIRQVRGAIIRCLVAEITIYKEVLFEKLGYEQELFDIAFEQLTHEQLIATDDVTVRIS